MRRNIGNEMVNETKNYFKEKRIKAKVLRYCEIGSIWSHNGNDGSLWIPNRKTYRSKLHLFTKLLINMQ